MLAVLQRIASSQQGAPCPNAPSPSPVTVPSCRTVALQQRQLQQLLYHHSQPGTAFQPQYSQQTPAPAAQAAALGAWPWQGPASATPPTGPQPCFSPRTFTQPSEAKPAFTADQQPCPRLDGSFLAECIKPPTPLPCVVNSCNQSVQLSSPLANQAQFSTTHAPMAGALPLLGNPETEPTTGMASPALSFSLLPSTSSRLSVAPKAEMAPGDGPYDCFGTSRHLYCFDHVCAACTKMSKCSCMLVLVCLQRKRHNWHTCSNCAHGQDCGMHATSYVSTVVQLSTLHILSSGLSRPLVL